MEKPEIADRLGPKAFSPAADLGEIPPVHKAGAAPRTDVVRMCSKCCRKLDAEGKALRKRVKAAIADTYGDAVQVEKADCFSLCPKGGQVISTSGKQEPRRLVILEPGSNIDAALAYLLG
jgi:hypothetical protein